MTSHQIIMVCESRKIFDKNDLHLVIYTECLSCGRCFVNWVIFKDADVTDIISSESLVIELEAQCGRIWHQARRFRLDRDLNNEWILLCAFLLIFLDKAGINVGNVYNEGLSFASDVWCVLWTPPLFTALSLNANEVAEKFQYVYSAIKLAGNWIWPWGRLNFCMIFYIRNLYLLEGGAAVGAFIKFKPVFVKHHRSSYSHSSTICPNMAQVFTPTYYLLTLTLHLLYIIHIFTNHCCTGRLKISRNVYQHYRCNCDYD